MNRTLTALSILALTTAAISCSSSAANTNQTANTNAVVSNSNVNTAGPAQNATDPTAPGVLVADLYKQHDAKNSPFFQTENRGAVDEYFTKATAEMIWKDAVNSKGEVGALGADPLYDAQDTRIKNFSVGRPEVSGGKAIVPVTFENLGKKQKINYTLAREDGVWKIEDIKYSDGRTLVRAYKEMVYDGPDDSRPPAGEPDVFGYFFIKGKVPEFSDISEVSLGGSGEYGAKADPPYYGLIRLKNKTDFPLLKPTISGKNIRFKTKEVGGTSYEFSGTLLRTDYSGGDIAPDEVVMKGTLSKISGGGAPVAGGEVEFTWSSGG